MRIATEHVVTVTLYVEKTYVLTGMDKDEAITEARNRVLYDVPETDPDLQLTYRYENHTKFID